MLELKLVDFETAKRLSKLGFPQNYDDAIYCVRDCYSEDGDYRVEHKEGELILYPSGFSVNDWITAPSLELVKKWMMEYKGYYIEIMPNFFLSQDKKIFSFKEYTGVIHCLKDETVKDYVERVFVNKRERNNFTKYDDALEWGIKKILTKLENI